MPPCLAIHAVFFLTHVDISAAALSPMPITFYHACRCLPPDGVAAAVTRLRLLLPRWSASVVEYRHARHADAAYTIVAVVGWSRDRLVREDEVMSR